MPLTPSPEAQATLLDTLNSIEVSRWEDDGQRVLVIVPYEERDPPADISFNAAAQFVSVDELDELIDVLIRQREWLAGQPTEPIEEPFMGYTPGEDQRPRRHRQQ